MNRNRTYTESSAAEEQSPAAPTEQFGSGLLKRLGLFGVLSIIGVSAYYGLFYESAQACYTRAKAAFPKDPKLSERLAEEAIAKADGSYPEAQFLQSRALAELGQWDTALGGFYLIRDPSGCDPQEILELAEKALAAEQWKLAELALETISHSDNPAYSRAMELRVRFNVQFQRLNEALSLCREWQKVRPQDALSWEISGDLEAAKTNLTTAIADYRQGLQHSPAASIELELRSALARLLFHHGDLPAAREEFDKLLKQGSLTAKDQLIYAQLLRAEGRFEEGLAEIQKYIQQAGENAEALRIRGILHHDSGQLAEASRDLKKSVELNPCDIGAQYKLSEVLLAQGDEAAAKIHRDKGKQLTEANDRIDEVEQQLRTDPGNTKLREEFLRLQQLLGKSPDPR